MITQTELRKSEDKEVFTLRGEKDGFVFLMTVRSSNMGSNWNSTILYGESVISGGSNGRSSNPTTKKDAKKMLERDMTDFFAFPEEFDRLKKQWLI